MKKASKVQWGYIVCPFPFANLVISLNKLGWRERKMKERFIERNETERKTERNKNFYKCHCLGTPTSTQGAHNPEGL